MHLTDIARNKQDRQSYVVGLWRRFLPPGVQQQSRVRTSFALQIESCRLANDVEWIGTREAAILKPRWDIAGQALSLSHTLNTVHMAPSSPYSRP